MKTKKHPTEVKNRAAELLIELQKIILHYGQSYKQLHSTNGYVSPERGNSGALLRPSARQRAMLVVDAENTYYCSLITSGYAA